MRSWRASVRSGRIWNVEIKRAKTQGFCFGVAITVKKAEEAVASGAEVTTLGHVVHNPQMVAKLEDQGLRNADSVDEVDSGTLFVRAHGLPVSVYEKAQQKGLTILDATCPMVTKIHVQAEKLRADGYKIIVIGDPNHAEVKGTLSHVPGAWCIQTADDVATLPRASRVGVVVQSTWSGTGFAEIVQRLTVKYYEVRAVNTICHRIRTTVNPKQRASRKNVRLWLWSAVNTLRTLGTSPSSRRRTALVRIVEGTDELEAEWFAGVQTAGLMSGASTPGWLRRDQVADRMNALADGGVKSRTRHSARALRARARRDGVGVVAPDGQLTDRRASSLALRNRDGWVGLRRGKRLRPRLSSTPRSKKAGRSNKPSTPQSASSACTIIRSSTTISRMAMSCVMAPKQFGRAMASRTASTQGDSMCAVSYLALLRNTAQLPPHRIGAMMQVLHYANLGMCAGQGYDIGFETAAHVTSDEYFAMIDGKPRHSLARRATWRAAAAGCDDERARAYGDLGRCYGRACQIRDDVLGTWGSTEETGKPTRERYRAAQMEDSGRMGTFWGTIVSSRRDHATLRVAYADGIGRRARDRRGTGRAGRATSSR